MERQISILYFNGNRPLLYFEFYGRTGYEAFKSGYSGCR